MEEPTTTTPAQKKRDRKDYMRVYMKERYRRIATKELAIQKTKRAIIKTEQNEDEIKNEYGMFYGDMVHAKNLILKLKQNAPELLPHVAETLQNAIC